MAPKSLAALAALLAALPSSALAQSACAGSRELTPCEVELYDVAGTWEERALVLNQRWGACVEKLQTRTATVINSLVVTPPCLDREPAPGWLLLGGAGAAGLVIGVLLGVFLE